jgi:hypothetical protein
MRSKNGFVAIALAVGVASAGLVGCPDKGAMEKTGEKIDSAVDDITHPGEGPVEKTARKMGEAVDDVKKDLTE